MPIFAEEMCPGCSHWSHPGGVDECQVVDCLCREGVAMPKIEENTYQDLEKLEETKSHLAMHVTKSTEGWGESALPFVFTDTQLGVNIGMSTVEAQHLKTSIEEGLKFLQSGSTRVYDLHTGQVEE